MKNIGILTVVFLLFPSYHEAQIPISKHLFGINAWYLDYSELTPNDFINQSAFHGKIAAVAASGCKTVRIGGIAINLYPLYTFDENYNVDYLNSSPRLVQLINLIRSYSMEPIIEVGYDPVCTAAPLSTLTMVEQASVAASLVKYLNHHQNGVYKNNPILYFVLANEPDLPFVSCNPPAGGLDLFAQTDAAAIAAYTRTYSALMKAEDPRIQIIGPELAQFGSDNAQDGNGNYYSPSNKIMEDLTANPSTSPATSIMGKIGGSDPNISNEYFIDIISFHHYAIPYFITNGATDIINMPSQENYGFAKTIQNNSLNRKGLIDMLSNSGRDASNLKIACTEFNIDLDDTTDLFSDYSTVINGYDSRSFLAGQWMVETFAEAMKKSMTIGTVEEPWVSLMNLWSVQEAGCDGEDAFGYIANCTVGAVANPSLSTYHHYEMMANNFKGTFYPSASVNQSNVKAFAAKSGDRIAVMILNQSSTEYSFAVNLNATPSSSVAALKIGFSIPNSSGGTEYVGDGSAPDQLTMKPHSTILLIYTCTGKASERRDYIKANVLADPLDSPYDHSVSLGTNLMGITGLPSYIPANTSQVINIGPSNYTVSWLGSTCGSVSAANQGLTVTLTACGNNNSTHIYTYTATDPEGCSVTQHISIQSGLLVHNNYQASMSVKSATCGLSNGSATVSMSGGSNNQMSPTCCSWDGGTPTSSVMTGLSPGPHAVSVVHGTTYAMNFVVNSTGVPPVNAGNDFYCGNYCNAYLSAWPDLTGNGYTYQWSEINTASVTSIPAGATATVAHWQTSAYKVVVTSTAVPGCTNEDVVQVTSHLSCMKKNLGVYGYPCGNPTARITSAAIQTETLNANTTINQDQYIDRIIVVPEGISLTIENCELAMRDSSKIIVAPGGTLTANKVFFHPCMKDAPWDGINGNGTGAASKINIYESVLSWETATS